MPKSYLRFVLTDSATAWFKLSMTVVGIHLVTLYFVSDSLVFILTKAVTGAVILLLLPGLATQHLLSARRSPHFVETVAFSIGISVIITIFLSVLVNFTPVGLDAKPILFILILYTVAVSTIAMLKEFQCLHINTF